MPLRIFITFAILISLVLPVGADKTIIQKTVTASEIDLVQVRIDDTGNLFLLVGYRVLSSLGGSIGMQRSISIPLTTAQQTTLKNFIINNVVPAINLQEGT